ncbi:Cof-type HAD-IIB family hydrolase [Zobellia uliginosa]|uniref:Cof-type HAD-IIB family hydrolase n=1 Tax=Zobellia uliginosa TaxID=143224 RepID=UPI001C073401|nr:Cof-type HAD-IIB family hydrolase [Zobellia uliginosa]MBU2946858.1 Cof-type HAD-IIB family hydrolase [Zobellia uliginosa]
MKYKILCSDLDGTLLTSKSDVSDFTISEIKRIKQHLKVILVSARMPSAMTYLQKDLAIKEQPIICYNGALVLDGDKELSSVYIGTDHLKKIYELSEANNTKLGLYYKNEWYVEEDSERVQKEIRYTKTTPAFRPTSETLSDWTAREIGAHKIMLMSTKESADILYPTLEEKLGKYLNLYRSNDTLIEVAPKSVSKLSAIKLVLQEDESLEHVISFGDNYNDIEMLENSGCGVAVGNAREEVKAVSNAVTLPNTENGVADYIKKHLVI